MKRPPARRALALLGGAALVGLGSVALGQQAPESLLPPGFGDAAPPPPAAPPVPPSGGTGAGQAAPPVDLLPSLPLTPPTDDADPLALDEEVPAEPLELPDYARRSVAAVGPFTDAGYGLPADAFGGADGRFLGGLMRRLDAPLPSRWESILLRRALLSRTAAPRRVNPVDWVAERAWLLLRLGEADGARMLVQSVDVDRYTPRMFQVAMQAALATADPAGFCPIAGPGGATSGEAAWPLAAAICDALSGEAATSGALLDRARAKRLAGGIDLLLTEKVIGAGANGRRAVNIEWDGVERLTAWRFGLASAVGLNIPDPLFMTVGPQVQAWRARAPMLAPSLRIAPARVAAALGVFSNASLVDLYGTVADQTDPTEIDQTDAGRLRAAYVGEDDAARMTAIRRLWDGARGSRDRYAAAVLTARAAARIRPDQAHAAETAGLVGAMFSAGLDRQAARWAPVVSAMSAAEADPAWAILAVGSERPVVDVGPGRVGAFTERAGEASRRAQLIVAALGGLGRLSPAAATRLAEANGLSLVAQDRWVRALDLAAQAGQQGTVALLVATGMQTARWDGVPAHYLYHMLTALRRVGLEGDARMIAAEAMTRS
ncbi:hypothetical protein [Sphingomonas solaris]|uniref:Uncharacterized protein n=1 Tax=Alterirhizorhabdus solaris TaxID=2529389 RepID=A0A558QXL4_9SPHN|nr:hypothetical protein [Sphingomonas solaris]TVV71848.1 hypothetical protein FOY91_16005 [Sphingomonas solaris]